MNFVCDVMVRASVVQCNETGLSDLTIKYAYIIISNGINLIASLRWLSSVAVIWIRRMLRCVAIRSPFSVITSTGHSHSWFMFAMRCGERDSAVLRTIIAANIEWYMTNVIRTYFNTIIYAHRTVNGRRIFIHSSCLLTLVCLCVLWVYGSTV